MRLHNTLLSIIYGIQQYLIHVFKEHRVGFEAAACLLILQNIESHAPKSYQKGK